MEILLDTANIELIKKYDESYRIDGVTTNPTIVAKEKAPFWPTLKEIRAIMGDRMMHVQVTAATYEDQLREAAKIVDVLGKEHTYIKVPTNETGIHTMKTLKDEGYLVTATAIYMPQQAMLAASVGADYVAPYFNRINNMNVDAGSSIADMVNLFYTNSLPTKVLAASFHNAQQIMDAFMAGAQAVTADPQYFTMMVENPMIDGAVEGFHKDWVGLYGDKAIFELD